MYFSEVWRATNLAGPFVTNNLFDCIPANCKQSAAAGAEFRIAYSPTSSSSSSSPRSFSSGPGARFVFGLYEISSVDSELLLFSDLRLASSRYPRAALLNLLAGIFELFLGDRDIRALGADERFEVAERVS